VDWLDQKIPPVTDHIEALYYEQQMEPVIRKNITYWLQKKWQTYS
jgi:hypothetical protein